MIKGRGIFVAVAGVALAGAAAGEHVSRRLIERRYHESVESRQKLELRFGEVLASHKQLESALKHEQEHSQELFGALGAMRGELEQSVGRLMEEARTVRELQVRLAAMQQQMDQLQGELAVTLQEHQGATPVRAPQRQSAPVQLEKIVVSDAGTLGLQGRVLSIHRDWHFVVIDLGWDTVKIGDIASVFRDEQLLAKVRVDRVQEGICAATLLPEWESADIRVNDAVKVL